MSTSPKHEVTDEDIDLLWRDKYHQMSKELIEDDLAKDLARLAAGEPLAYVIGWIPFLGLTIYLDSRPLIPRPETEWWTEKLITHLQKKFGDSPFEFLDLCAGSGAIGLAVLKNFPKAHVTFSEISPEHAAQITRNARANEIPYSQMDIYVSDLYSSFPTQKFDIIATNPPYIPTTRTLPAEVVAFEPSNALYAGTYGLDYIRTIVMEAKQHLNLKDGKMGELWMECDIDNISKALELAKIDAKHATIHEDLYGRPRIIVAHFT